MPNYDYQCNQCKKTFTVTTSIKEHEKNPTPQCEHCGSKDVKRVFSNVTVITSKKS